MRQSTARSSMMIATIGRSWGTGIGISQHPWPGSPACRQARRSCPYPCHAGATASSWGPVSAGGRLGQRGLGCRFRLAGRHFLIGGDIRRLPGPPRPRLVGGATGWVRRAGVAATGSAGRSMRATRAPAFVIVAARADPGAIGTRPHQCARALQVNDDGRADPAPVTNDTPPTRATPSTVRHPGAQARPAGSGIPAFLACLSARRNCPADGRKIVEIPGGQRASPLHGRARLPANNRSVRLAFVSTSRFAIVSAP